MLVETQHSVMPQVAGKTMIASTASTLLFEHPYVAFCYMHEVNCCCKTECIYTSRKWLVPAMPALIHMGAHGLMNLVDWVFLTVIHDCAQSWLHYLDHRVHNRDRLTGYI